VEDWDWGNVQFDEIAMLPQTEGNGICKVWGRVCGGLENVPSVGEVCIFCGTTQ